MCLQETRPVSAPTPIRELHDCITDVGRQIEVIAAAIDNEERETVRRHAIPMLDALAERLYVLADDVDLLQRKAG